MSPALNAVCLSASILEGTKAKLSKSEEKKDTSDLWAGLILLAANLFQLVFVNKNDYSIEKSADEYHPEKIQLSSEKEPPASLAELPSPIATRQQSWNERVTQMQNNPAISAHTA